MHHASRAVAGRWRYNSPKLTYEVVTWICLLPWDSTPLASPRWVGRNHPLRRSARGLMMIMMRRVRDHVHDDSPSRGLGILTACYSWTSEKHVFTRSSQQPLMCVSASYFPARHARGAFHAFHSAFHAAFHSFRAALHAGGSASTLYV